MTLEYWFVNGMLVQNRATRDWLIMQEFAAGREVTVRPVERDSIGNWVLPLMDPKEQ